MKIDIKHLGNIRSANIKLNNLLIFTGESNSGKTYLNYMLYALLDQKFTFGRSHIFSGIVKKYRDIGIFEFDMNDFLQDNKQKILSDFKNSFKNSLGQFFSTTQDMFKSFEIDFVEDEILDIEKLTKLPLNSRLKIGKDEIVCEIIKKENSTQVTIIMKESKTPNDILINFLEKTILKFLLNNFYHDAFILPAERSGLSLFYQELNSKRNALMNNLQKAEIHLEEVIKDLIISKYPQPIADFIDFLNNTQFLKKNKSELSDIANYLHSDIVGGKYKVDKDGISFMPYKTKYKSNNFKDRIDLHLTSSTVKTFFSLSFYIMHMAKKDDILIIDEPELNLHPDNQRKTARLIAKLVNSGVKVILSTHSDYIIKELNNLIMLNEEFPSRDKLCKKYAYKKEEFLDSSKINAYFVRDGEVEELENSNKEGIIAKSFDDVINKLNNSSDDIYYTKQEELNSEY